MARRAKIVCTLGPATAGFDTMVRMVDAGMNVARLNLSHGSHDDHQRSIEQVRAATDAAGKGVAILADLQGPKIRLGKFAGGTAQLEVGTDFTITVDNVVGNQTRCSTTYDGLPGCDGCARPWRSRSRRPAARVKSWRSTKASTCPALP